MNRIRSVAHGTLAALVLGLFLACGLMASDMDSALKNVDPKKNTGEGTAGVCTPAPTAPSSGAGGYPMDGTFQVNTRLNVREGPWGKIIGSLKGDEKIKITGVEGDWYKIEYKGKTAYVHKNYVSTASTLASRIAPTPPGGSSGGGSSGGSGGGASGGGSSGGGSGGATPVTPGNGRFGGSPARPMARVNSPYGMRRHPIYGDMRMHNGVDVPLPGGTPLLALGDGVVTFAATAGGAGKMITIRYDNGYESTYMHLQGFDVQQGARVSQGQQVGRVDTTGSSTGNHLHFEMKANGSRVNPQSVSGIQW